MAAPGCVKIGAVGKSKGGVIRGWFAAIGLAVAVAAVVGVAVWLRPAPGDKQPNLPLGDDKVTSTAPRVGWLYACESFADVAGAVAAAPWIKGSIWYPERKPAVLGGVLWDDAYIKITVADADRVIRTMGVPVGSKTGIFPIKRNDPAYQYDRVPYAIVAKRKTVSVPANPVVAAAPGCVRKGVIGFMLNGVAIYSAVDGLGRDAVAHSVLDVCDGQPDRTGTYHYYNGSRCILDTSIGFSVLIGYALDGFGIYVEREPLGNLLTNAALDECHGRTGPVLWDGAPRDMYHYVATAEFPYLVGCFRGSSGLAVVGY